MIPAKKVPRAEVFKLIAAVRADVAHEADLKDFLLDMHQDSGNTSPQAVQEAVSDCYAGTSNGFLALVYELLTGRRVEVTGEPQNLFECPCCGFKTLDELLGAGDGGWDICRVCGWEEEGTRERDKHVSVNRGSMNQYMQRVQENPNVYYTLPWLKGRAQS